MFGLGHTPPANFVAGQISDGASIGTFQLKDFGGVSNPVLTVFLRYYQNKLIGLCEVRNASGGVLPNENMSIKQREYFQNIFGRAEVSATDGPLTNKINAFKNLIPLVASQAELAAMGLTPDGQVPGSGSGKIPYQQDADGNILAYAGGTTPGTNPTPATPGASLVPNSPNTPATPDTSTTPGGVLKKYPWLKWVAIAVGVLALAYGGYILMKKRKKKGK